MSPVSAPDPLGGLSPKILPTRAGSSTSAHLQRGASILPDVATLSARVLTAKLDEGADAAPQPLLPTNAYPEDIPIDIAEHFLGPASDASVTVRFFDSTLLADIYDLGESPLPCMYNRLDV